MDNIHSLIYLRLNFFTGAVWRQYRGPRSPCGQKTIIFSILLRKFFVICSELLMGLMNTLKSLIAFLCDLSYFRDANIVN